MASSNSITSLLFTRRNTSFKLPQQRGTSVSDLSVIWLLALTRIPISRLDGGKDHKTFNLICAR